MKNDIDSNTPDDILEVTIFDEPRQNIREGYPDVLNHPEHYKQWREPSQAQVQIVCHQTVLDSIQKHAASYANQEIGGILVGHYYRSDDASYLEIMAYVPAPREGRGQNSASHFTFTQTIWAEMLTTKDRDPALNQKDIVGWFHSHPNWGTQPSSLDIGIQQEHFKYEWQTALIYDPIRHEGDFYLWDNGALVTAPGFYEIFSRIRPTVVTNWRNYLTVAPSQTTQDVNPKNTERGGEFAQDVAEADQEQDKDHEQGTEEDTAAEQGFQPRRTLPTADTPLRPNQEEISITNEDILRTFLQRHWAELLIMAAIGVLIPLLIYMGYQLVSGFFQEPEPSPQIPLQAEHWGGSESQMYDPRLKGVHLKINGEEIDKKLDILRSDADNTNICVYNSQYAKAVNSTSFLLGLKNQGEYGPPSVYLPAESSDVSEKGVVCFVYDLSLLPLTTWHGAIYTIGAEGRTFQVEGKDEQMVQVVHFLSEQEPSFDILLYEDTRETDE